MNLIEIEKVVGKIQNQLFKKANSQSVGAFKSHFRGAGLQFREHQLYNPGDDVRFIDWKLSAKSVGKTYIKTFEEDRNVEVVVVIDIAETLLMGYRGVSKLQMAIELTCLLYLLTNITKDRVKVVVFHKEITQLPSLSGKEGITVLISFLEKIGYLDNNGKVVREPRDFTPVDKNKRTSLLKSFVARKKEVVFLSDFYNFDELKDIKKLVYSRNFHCFRLSCPLDRADSIPFSFIGTDNSKKSQYVYREKGKKTKQIDDAGKRIKEVDVSETYLENFVNKISA